MYEIKIPYKDSSMLFTSNGFGGSENIALTKSIINLIRASVQKTKIKKVNAGIKLCIFLFLAMI